MPTHIVCVNHRDYCGQGRRYVEHLHDMVRRHLPADSLAQFACFTDDPQPYAAGIDKRSLPEGLNGWYNKLSLFRRGLFPEGDRVVYFDLDTLIIGPLDEILAYDGEFAILRDFLRQGGFGSGVMLWRAGVGHDIWESFLAEGFPHVEGGDQIWIERHRPPRVDPLQERFPGRFVSYKLHCQLQAPAAAAVVCFHGLPRPHEATTGWVPLVWWPARPARQASPPEPVTPPEARFWLDNAASFITPRTALEHPEGFDPGPYMAGFFVGCSSVSDVGCGRGRLSAGFRPDIYLGLDINADVLAAARRTNPDHRYAGVLPGEAFPPSDGMLFYCVLLLVSDAALPDLLARATAAARRVVIGEIMDRRWRRGGEPPVFNRELEDYVIQMNRLGYVLRAHDRRIYEHYNNELWWGSRDTRLTVLAFERA